MLSWGQMTVEAALQMVAISKEARITSSPHDPYDALV